MDRFVSVINFYGLLDILFVASNKCSFVIKQDIPSLIPNCSSGANPTQPPLDRGGARIALPLLRGSRRGFGFNGIPGLNNYANVRFVRFATQALKIEARTLANVTSI
jgi:hypothetical protein